MKLKLLTLSTLSFALAACWGEKKEEAAPAAHANAEMTAGQHEHKAAEKGAEAHAKTAEAEHAKVEAPAVEKAAEEHKEKTEEVKEEKKA